MSEKKTNQGNEKRMFVTEVEVQETNQSGKWETSVSLHPRIKSIILNQQRGDAFWMFAEMITSFRHFSFQKKKKIYFSSCLICT